MAPLLVGLALVLGVAACNTNPDPPQSYQSQFIQSLEAEYEVLEAEHWSPPPGADERYIEMYGGQ